MAEEIVPALLGFVFGMALGLGMSRSARRSPRLSANFDFVRTKSSVKVVDLLVKQQIQVSLGILELTIRQGEPGAQDLNLAGKIAQLNVELQRLQTRCSLAQTDAAAIPFPGDETIAALRSAVGKLESAVGKGGALGEILAKVSAAIAAWKP
jgi:hypothetical protein